MKRVLFAFILLLAACGRQLPLAEMTKTQAGSPAVTDAPMPGQETHGGDLAVAMVRSALMTGVKVPAIAISMASRIMTSPAYSVEGRDDAPLLTDLGDTLVINRARLLKIIPEEIPWELVSKPSQAPHVLVTHKVRPVTLGPKMTPEKIRERAQVLFASLAMCYNASNSINFLFPDFNLRAVDEVRVEYSDKPLYDRKMRKRVDIGATIEENPRILLDPSRVGWWTESNYATDYIIYHEYAHVLLRKAGRSDDDHLVGTMLFYQCSRHSERFKLHMLPGLN